MRLAPLRQSLSGYLCLKNSNEKLLTYPYFTARPRSFKKSVGIDFLENWFGNSENMPDDVKEGIGTYHLSNQINSFCIAKLSFQNSKGKGIYVVNYYEISPRDYAKAIIVELPPSEQPAEINEIFPPTPVVDSDPPLRE